MMRLFLKIILIFFIIIFHIKTTFGQTLVKEKIFRITQKDYYNCFKEEWNLTIPILSFSSVKDIRYSINDSISKIANAELDDTINYTSNSEKINSDCDTTSISFTSPTEHDIFYTLGQNTKRLLSFELYVRGIAGGGGIGFGTDYYSFSIDLSNNKIFHITSLFDSTNTKKLLKYCNENIKKPREDISFEDFNIFGSSGENLANGWCEYVGFRIDKTSIILEYNTYGRGEGVNDIILPLKDIKPFINKKYQWICESNE